jgi:hypothetical protein
VGSESTDRPDTGRRGADSTGPARDRPRSLLWRPGLVGERPTEGATAVGYALVGGALLGSLATLGGGLTDRGLLVLAAAAALGQAVTNDGVVPSVGAGVALTSGGHAVVVPVAVALGQGLSLAPFVHAAALGLVGGTVGCAAGLLARRGSGILRSGSRN